MGTSSELRETLFGDVPLRTWGVALPGPPWRQFQEAEARLRRADAAGAREALTDVLALTGLESRHYLQAWTSLRTLAVVPPDEEAQRLLGMVLDVPLEGGLDTLAAYEDGSARYLNHSGAVIVWDAPDPGIQQHVDALLAVGREILRQIDPWSGPRPALPTGAARVSLLTPNGLHFGQASFEALAEDALAGPAFATGATLMQALIERTER